MKFFAKAFITAALYSFLCGAAVAAPVQTQLTADVMDYDMETGVFKARGNVTLVREGVTMVAPFGEAFVQTSKARMWSPAHAYGIYQNEKLDAVCTQIEADFSVPGADILMNGEVDALFGDRVLKSDTARLVGKVFSATNVTHFEDKSRAVVISCEKIDGDYDNAGVRVVTGTGHVVAVREEEARTSRLWCEKLIYSRAESTTTATGTPRMRIEQRQGGGPRDTLIEGDALVHSSLHNTVTSTGRARAVQDGRNIRAQRLIYDMASGKIEARGTPRITVDLSKRSQQRGNSGSDTQKKGQKRSGS